MGMFYANPPTDPKAWWLAPHCGPGQLDPNLPGRENCNYCDNTHLECALKCTEAVRTTDPSQPLDTGYYSVCGASGLWCPGCGRFWAMDACGDSSLGELQCVDDTGLESRSMPLPNGEGFHLRVFCPCGYDLGQATNPHLGQEGYGEDEEGEDEYNGDDLEVVDEDGEPVEDEEYEEAMKEYLEANEDEDKDDDEFKLTEKGEEIARSFYEGLTEYEQKEQDKDGHEEDEDWGILDKEWKKIPIDDEGNGEKPEAC